MANDLPSAPAGNEPLRRRWLASRFLCVSVLVHVLFLAGAGIWVVQMNRSPPKRAFRSLAVPPDPSTHALEYKVQLKRRHALSALPEVKRATAVGPSRFALPPMPMMPRQPALAAANRVPGTGGGGMTVGSGAPRAGVGLANPGIALFMAPIGGLNVQARQLAVALDVSGSVRQYREALESYVSRTFKGSQVGTFTWAGFKNTPSRTGSIGTVVLGFLRSPTPFDAIYIFSDFGETNASLQDAWAEVQKLTREKKVRLYLHVLREPGKETQLKPALAQVIAFARNSGGSVKIGAMPQM